MKRHPRVIAVTLAVLLLMASQVAQAATVQCDAGDVQCLIAALNQAVADPNHKTTIRLAGGTYALTDVDNNTNGPNGLPSIVSTVEIDGGKNGATLTRTSGAPDFRILQVGPNGRLTLDGVHLVGGSASSGGALLNDRGVVAIADCSFGSNSAGAGGAVFTNLGTMTITDTTFASGLAGGGGGLVNAGGMVTLTRTVFDGNHANEGGGLWSDHGTTYISDSRFIHNGAAHGVGGLWVTGGTASIIRTTLRATAGIPMAPFW